MFDELTREESMAGIRSRVEESNKIPHDATLTHSEKRQKIDVLHNEIRELWYHIYDLEGKPYKR